MKTITFLMLHLGYGGLERQVVTLANTLSDKYNVKIISVYKIGSKSAYQLKENINVKYLLPYGPNREEYMRAIENKNIIKIIYEGLKAAKILYLKRKLMHQAIKDEKTDVLISTRIEFSSLIKRNDIKTISQEHSYINNPNYIKQVQKSFKYIDYLVVMTDYAKEQYEKWLGTRRNVQVVKIPNVINKVEGEKSTCKNKKIISVGRLVKLKRHDELIKIFYKINKRYSDWQLIIVGDGEERERLESLVSSLELDGKVEITGMLPPEEVNKKLLDSSIFVLTSESESFSLVLCEAMACGLPVLSFDIDVGPREIIENGKDGFLVKELDNLEMYRRIEQLIRDTELRIEMGKKAIKKASYYYVSNIMSQWYNIIEK